MYCPKCFNNSIELCTKGVVDIVINGKHMDSGRFNFRLDENFEEQNHQMITQKVEEFFVWYSRFHNVDPIQEVQLVTSNIRCSSGCAIDSNTKVSVIDGLIPRKKLEKILIEFGKKYSLQINLADI